MQINKISNLITSSKLAKNVSKASSNAAKKVGSGISSILEKSPKADTFKKVLSAIEPTGGVNAFIPMASLMVGTVVVPRVITAGKRNPDDKEATKDEITEILFRDVQTILVVLFLLKATNSIVAGKTTKISGLPMTNKPYEKIFDSEEKGIKKIAQNFVQTFASPILTAKKAGKNLIDTLHPTQGVYALTNDEFVAKYSNYNSIDEIKKMLDSIPSQGGDKNKVFNKIMDILIKDQTTFLEGNNKISKGKVEGLIQQAKRTAKDGKIDKVMQERIDQGYKILDNLKAIKEKGVDSFNSEIPKDAAEQIISFMQDKNNRLVNDAKGLNASLRTAALAFEAAYLGFGIPALNQKRLEKKYLSSEAKKPVKSDNNGALNPLVDKNIKAHEIKIFHNFIK